MNCYADLTTLKRRLSITGTGDDTDLLQLLNAASKAMNLYTDRFFYCDETTRYYDGTASPILLDDLLSVTTFKLDEDGDGTFESTMATTDYLLYPLNEYPKLYAKISNDSDYGGFASGIRKGVEIAGVFGFGDGQSSTPYVSSGDTVQDDPLSSSATTIDVTDGDNFAEGQTLRIESEQVYVSSISTNTLTVSRGVNGTTAAEHVQTTAISIYQYPEDIAEATIIQAARLWKRKDTAFGNMTGFTDIGTAKKVHGLDQDVKQIVLRYKRRTIR
ncbi:MAG: hypothetical protein SVY53_12165 [Chloroflexota bacterium]|nr:hypothetical protein [Chloroflexota bacterium]